MHLELSKLQYVYIYQMHTVSIPYTHSAQYIEYNELT